MSKARITEPRKPLYALILESQDRDFREVYKRLGMTKTAAIGEALQYWLAAQRRMGVVSDGRE